jgi:hypothetical protein
MKYKLVNNKYREVDSYNYHSIDKFSEIISELCNEGWVPLGGVSLVYIGGAYLYTQAMCKN